MTWSSQRGAWSRTWSTPRSPSLLPPYIDSHRNPQTPALTTSGTSQIDTRAHTCYVFGNALS